MTVQFLVMMSPSSRHILNGFSVPSDWSSPALISDWRLRSASNTPLPKAVDDFSSERAYFTAAGPATKPAEMQLTSEFAPRRLAPWYWYSHAPAAYRPGMFVAWL